MPLRLTATFGLLLVVALVAPTARAALGGLAHFETVSPNFLGVECMLPVYDAGGCFFPEFGSPVTVTNCSENINDRTSFPSQVKILSLKMDAAARFKTTDEETYQLWSRQGWLRQTYSSEELVDRLFGTTGLEAITFTKNADQNSAEFFELAARFSRVGSWAGGNQSCHDLPLVRAVFDMPLSRLTITEKLVLKAEGVISKFSFVADPAVGEPVEEIKMDVNCLSFQYLFSNRADTLPTPTLMKNTFFFTAKYLDEPACVDAGGE
ncbi:hypothetical protein QOT17_005846 [Balamuthia mandrillaris]